VYTVLYIIVFLIIFFNLLQICFHLARLVNFRPTDCYNLTITPDKRNATAPASCELHSDNRPCLWFTYNRQSNLI
jgi:hypothetical protein